MNIYPSILEDNLDKFSAQFTKLAPYFDHFQIDIADGEFVPHKTVQVDELVNGKWYVVNGLGDGEMKMNEKTFEFHLMVNDIMAELKKLESLATKIKVTKVLVHLKPFTTHYLPQTSPRTTHHVSSTNLELGIVLSPEDQVVPNLELIKTFQTVQLMTIHPGAQGNPFMPEMLNKINELRENGFTGDIILDGGINNETLPVVLKNNHLPTAVCPGSYLHEDTEERLERLRKLVNGK